MGWMDGQDFVFGVLMWQICGLEQKACGLHLAKVVVVGLGLDHAWFCVGLSYELGFG